MAAALALLPGVCPAGDAVGNLMGDLYTWNDQWGDTGLLLMIQSLQNNKIFKQC